MPEYSGCGPIVLHRDPNIVLAHDTTIDRLVFADKRELEAHPERTHVVVQKWTWMKHPDKPWGRFVDVNMAVSCCRQSDDLLSGDTQLRCMVGPNEKIFNSWWALEPAVCEEISEDEANEKDQDLVYRKEGGVGVDDDQVEEVEEEEVQEEDEEDDEEF